MTDERRFYGAGAAAVGSYGALTFYLGHKDEVDNDMAARERVEDAFSEAHPAPSHLKEKLVRGVN